MLELDINTGLPAARALANRLGPNQEDTLSGYLEKALLTPAVTLSERPSKKLRAQLVGLAYELCGGPLAAKAKERLTICAQAVELLHSGSLIIDDIQDDSRVRRGGEAIHLIYGMPQAICTGNWLFFWPLRLIRELELGQAAEHRIFTIYHDALELAHSGQALDLSLKFDLTSVPQRAALALVINELKSGTIVSLAMLMGGVIAEASDEQLAAIDCFGRRFGVALQKLDDLGNLVGHCDPERCREDLHRRKLSSVWHLAEVLGESERFAAAVDAFLLSDATLLDTWLVDSNFVARSRALIARELDEALGELRKDLRLPADSRPLTMLHELSEVLLDVYI